MSIEPSGADSRATVERTPQTDQGVAVDLRICELSVGMNEWGKFRRIQNFARLTPLAHSADLKMR